MSMILVVLIGVVGGLAGALQGSFVGIMEAKAGTLVSTFVTYGGGGLAIALTMLAFGGARLSDLRDVPWWALTAGLMGLVIVASLGITISNLGLGAGLTLFTGGVDRNWGIDRQLWPFWDRSPSRRQTSRRNRIGHIRDVAGHRDQPFPRVIEGR